MKLLVYLDMFFIFLNSFATAHSLIRDCCKKGADIEPRLVYDRCMKTIEGDQKCKAAKNLEELVMASAEIVLLKTTSVKGLTDKILIEKKPKKEIGKLLRCCVEAYTNSTRSLINEGIPNLKSRDYPAAIKALTYAMDTPENCQSGFEVEADVRKTKKDLSPITKENDDLFHTALVTVSFTYQLSHKPESS